jgi:regulator of ribosome biosynthesis
MTAKRANMKDDVDDQNESGDSSGNEVMQQDSSSSGEEEQGGADNNDVNEEDELMDEEDDDENSVEIPTSKSVKESLQLPKGVEKCSFDLKNLVAINSYPLNPNKLYIASAVSPAGKVVNEDYLLTKASEACQQLIAATWSLPREVSANAGPLALLPGTEEIIKTPRSLPPPPPRVESKWDKFAKERGLPTKQKRERKVFDEATGEWMYRHGYQKANKKDQEWPIMEVKRDTNPFDDPWQKDRDAKRARVDKNLESRMRNQERAGVIPRGSAKKLLKDKSQARELGKEGGAKGVQLPPSGLPVDLRTGKATGEIRNSMKRGKELTQRALLATQRSTASLGKFDKMREGEPERKSAVRRRNFEVSTPSSKKRGGGSSVELERQTKVLNNVMSGGAKRDKMKRDGSLAKGETAYDYDYSDGLGPSSFKKKKGRAGEGKIKKVTKKRIK